MIVDIVDPMLRTAIVVAEGLGVLERLPLPVDEAPRWMILNLFKHTMRQHYLRDVVCILGAVHEELHPSQSCTNVSVAPNGFAIMYASM